MPASKAMPLAFATLAAIAVQPLVLLVWLVGPSRFLAGSLPPLTDLGAIALFTSIVATPFVLLIGLPSALLLRHHPRRGWWLAMIGLLATSLPVAALSSNDITSLPDLGAVLVFGLHGLAGATAFHHAWRLAGDPPAAAAGLTRRAGAAPNPRRSGRRCTAAPAAAEPRPGGR
jgi:hypothetical protein